MSEGASIASGKIFLRMRLLRLWNILNSGSAFRKGKAGAKAPRLGTGSRFTPGALSGIGIFLIMTPLLYSFHQTRMSVMETAYGKVPVDYAEALSIFVFMNFFGGLFLTLGSNDFRKTEWDLEWLITLPLSKTRLIAFRIVERAFFNPIYLYTIYPPFCIIARGMGYSWGRAIPLSYLAALPLLVLAAGLQTLIDTGFRIAWTPARVKNLQALTVLLGVGILYFMNLTPTRVALPVALTKDFFGTAILYSPMGLAVMSFLSGKSNALYFTAGIVESMFGVFAVFAMLLFLMRNGVASGSGQSSIRISNGVLTRKLPSLAWKFFSTFTVREWKMLLRDHSYLAQTLLAPVMILSLQVYFAIQKPDLFGHDVHTSAAIAFGIAAYSMMNSCYMGLISEGGALWILYTFPRSIMSSIVEKISRWAWFACAYIFAFYLWFVLQNGHAFSFETLSSYLLAMLGIPLMMAVGVSLGILGFEGSSYTSQRRMKVASFYIYLFFEAVYVSSFFLPSLWSKFLCVFFSVLIAYAFWQKASDRLPYLLDTASLPDPTVSLSDGIIAAQIFFVLQALFTLFQTNSLTSISGPVLFRAFAGAGFGVWLGFRLYYYRVRGQNLPSFLPKKLSDLKYGVLAGFGSITVAFLYLHFFGREAWFQKAAASSLSSQKGLGIWIAACAVLAAPLFEEFIFRGLVYRGLRRGFGKWTSALLSAVIFSVIHPPISILPVFVMGFSSALVFEETGTLGASVLTHLLYNFGVVWLGTS